jgi:hypothetical protein
VEVGGRTKEMKGRGWQNRRRKEERTERNGWENGKGKKDMKGKRKERKEVRREGKKKEERRLEEGKWEVGKKEVTIEFLLKIELGRICTYEVPCSPFWNKRASVIFVFNTDHLRIE